MIDAKEVSAKHLFSYATVANTLEESFGDEIHHYLEKDAFNDKAELVVDKHESLNKLGHALHVLEPTFNRITFSSKAQQLVSALGFEKPRVVQSMYIFKNPRIGGVVLPHQDASYLNAIPKKSGDKVKVMGLWMPLEDATVRNQWDDLS